MGRSKINMGQLGDLLREEISTQEIAQRFKCSERAVQKAVAKLKKSVTDFAVRHHARERVQQDLDAREQLLKINESANRLLDLLEAQLRQDRDDLVAGIILEVRRLLPETGKGLIEDLEKMVVTRPATVELLLKAQAEIRQQIALVVKVAGELLEAKRVEDCLRIMREEIGAESTECAARIIQRLKGSQLLFSVCGLA